MAEVTAMEAVENLDGVFRKVAWGALIKFENDWSKNHWEEDSKLLDPAFDPSKPETVKNYLSQIYDKQTES